MTADSRPRRLQTSAGSSATRRLVAMLAAARLPGVSHQTVSRVLNQPTGVRPETRRRVLDAIRELDDQPDSGAGGRLQVRARSGPAAPTRGRAGKARNRSRPAFVTSGRDHESYRPL
jgi:hypothetical protein